MAIATKSRVVAYIGNISVAFLPLIELWNPQGYNRKEFHSISGMVMLELNQP